MRKKQREYEKDWELTLEWEKQEEERKCPMGMRIMRRLEEETESEENHEGRKCEVIANEKACEGKVEQEWDVTKKN